MDLNKKILFIYISYSSFVKTDCEILSGEYAVTRYRTALTKGFFNLVWCLLKQMVFLLFNARKFDVFYIWFADYHAFLPVLFARILRKKSIIVNGGYDVARLPEYHYGVFNSKLRGILASYAMKNCTMNLPVSKYVARKVRAVTGKENYRVVYNCVNLPASLPAIRPERNYVLTVGLIDSERTWFLKGIDTFAEVARLLPRFPFYIVGLNSEKLRHLTDRLPPNIRIFKAVAHDELIDFYSKAKVYCQFSRVESFGIALAEAMQCGCIPVVTSEGGMPEIVGDKSLIFKRDVQMIAGKIDTIIRNFPDTDNFAFINRDSDFFSVIRRKNELVKIIG